MTELAPPAAPIARPAAPSDATRPHTSLLGLALSSLLAALGTSIAHVALPTLSREFGTSFQAVQWVGLAYLVAVTSLLVGAGRLGDILGRRRMLLTGLGVFTLASAAAGLAPTLGCLIAARVAQGLGAAVMMALTLAAVSELRPPEKIGRALGWLGSMSAVGTALGPAVGGGLIALWGWRAIFLASVPLGAVAWLLVRRALPADRRTGRATRDRFDGMGTFLLVITLAAYALALTLGRGRFGAINLGLLMASVAGAVGLVRAERVVISPLIPNSVLRDSSLRVSLIASALVATLLMATLVVGPFYLSLALGLGSAHVGLAMSAGPIVAALVSAPAGRWVERWGAPRLAQVGLLGLALGSLALAGIPTNWGVGGYLAGIVVITGSYALFQTANTTAVMGNVSPERRGVISGMLNASRHLGLITGTTVMGGIFAWTAGTNLVAGATADAVATGMKVTFALGAGVALLAGTILKDRGSRTVESPGSSG